MVFHDSNIKLNEENLQGKEDSAPEKKNYLLKNSIGSFMTHDFKHFGKLRQCLSYASWNQKACSFVLAYKLWKFNSAAIHPIQHYALLSHWNCKPVKHFPYISYFGFDNIFKKNKKVNHAQREKRRNVQNISKKIKIKCKYVFNIVLLY